MSFFGALGQEQLASQTSHIDQPAENKFNLADHFHVRQMERTLEHTLEELEQVKSRLSQLEKAMAERGEGNITACEGSEQLPPAPLTHPLPITEISQLAEMAKRLK
ncbi:MAG: hypothetical protein ABSG97_04435 [Sedimentisphaerales bacterium]|jgi:hypothetical protein